MARLIKPPGLILPRGYQKPALPIVDWDHPLSKGLIAYWPFGDTAAGVANELANGQGGAISGALTLGPSHHGGSALVFDGTNYVTAPASVQPSASLSFFAWIKGTSFSNTYNTVATRVSSASNFWQIAVKSTGKLAVVTAPNNVSWNNIDPAASVLSTGVWYFVGFTWDQTTLRVYINAVQDASAATRSGSVAGSVAAFGIGQDLNTSGRKFNGSIEGVRMYSRALSPTEILRLYSEPYAGVVRAPAQLTGVVDLNVTLTGQAMTPGQGSVALGAAVALTGQAATSARGTITTTAQKTLSGQAVTSAQGTLSLSTLTYKGYAFRATLAGGTGFPGDRAEDTWCGTSNYVASAQGGAGYGWNFGPGGNLSNRNSPVNARYGGQISNNNSTEWFRIDVPKGLVDVRLLLGSGNNAVRLRYGPGSVSGTDYTDVQGVTSTTYPAATDATGAIFTDANAWDAGNTPLRVNNIAGYLELDKIPSIGFNSTTFISYRVVPTALADCTFTDEIGAAGAPTLHQNEVAGKYIGTIVQNPGGTPATTLGVFESDGTTPSLYLEIQYIGNTPWLVQTATQMPDLGGTYNFKLIQTDVSGQAIYSNSPYVQSLSWTVAAASTKPYNDGTFLSKISAAAYLMRKTVVDIFNQSWNPTTKVGEWLGYTGGGFDFTATVYNIAALKAQLIAYAAAAQASTNKKYQILIDVDGTSDWDTHYMTIPGNAYTGKTGLDFNPDGGNLCYVTYAAGPKAGPVLAGGWNILSYVRGLHCYGLVWGLNGGTSDPSGGAWAWGAIVWASSATTTTAFTLLKVDNCDIGLLFNPTYISGGGGTTPTTVDTTKYQTGFGTSSNGNSFEQLIVSNCRFWGVNIAFQIFGGRMVHLSNIDVALCNNDTITPESIPSSAVPYLPDCNQYEWYDNVNLRYIYNYDSGIHADFLQQRNLGSGSHDPSAQIYRLFENGSCLLNFTDAAMQRNVIIMSDTVAPNLNSCFLNNIFASYATRGIETGAGNGVSYVEYNSLGPCHLTGVGMTVQSQSIFSSGGAKIYSRNNIAAASGGENVVLYSAAKPGSVDPNTIMVGPFAADANNSARWAGPVINEAVPTYSLDTYRAGMQAAFRSVSAIDAGFQPGLTLAGQAGIGSQGLLSFSATLGISGISAGVSGGTVTPTAAMPVIGQVGTAHTGSLAYSMTAALAGQAAAAAQGALDRLHGIVIAGMALSSQTGVLLTSIARIVRYLRGNRSSVTLRGDSDES